LKKDKLNILILNSYDIGGASIAAIRFHQALLKSGVNSRLMTLHKTRNDIPEHYQYHVSGGILKKIWLKLRQRSEHRRKNSLTVPENESLSGKFSIPLASYQVHDSPHWKWADVVNLHWVNEWISAEVLVAYAKGKPLIWTLHDEHLFTGGCHYSERCNGFETDCNNCPLLVNSSQPDIANHSLNAKLHAFQQFPPNLKIVAPSGWMVKKAARSSLLNQFDGKRIFNSLDKEVFLPVPQDVCREVLGIPREKTVLLSVTQSLDDERKGFRILKEALDTEGLPENWILCTVGKSNEGFSVSGIEYKHLGSIQDQRLMAIIYNAASVFVHPATEDNLPNVVAESLMCGIPVAGFAIGGMPEMVNEENGCLADTIGPESLLEAIHKALSLGAKKNSISAAASELFSPERQAREFMALAESMVGQSD
jgi:glycosyltransferase involved in cell wall biosynthesis